MQSKFNELAKRFGIAVVALVMLGLAGVFGLCEPASASAKVVTSGDVRLVSERIVPQPDMPAAGKNGRTGRNGYYGHNGPL